MKKNYILLVAGLFILSSCETTGSGSGEASLNNSTTADSSTLQNYLQREIGDRVFFDTDKHNVSAAAARTLESQANWLNSTPGFNIRLEGHCDERGTREYNLALGERRANAVKDFLISFGVAASRIETRSFGKERPAAEGSTAEAWAENRRVVTIIGE